MSQALRLVGVPLPSPSLGASYAMTPTVFIGDPRINDSDFRTLALLDRLGWCEGERSGTFTRSYADLAALRGRAASTLRDSIKRLAKISPPLIRVTQNPGDACTIALLYDRTGIGLPPLQISGGVNDQTPRRESVGPPTGICRTNIIESSKV